MTSISIWRKEWLEAIRSYRIVVLPLIFLLLGMGQPLAIHFMPALLEQSGLPEGAVIEFPVPPPAEIVAMAIDQYNQVGLFVLILAAMGLINREIESGMAGLLFTLRTGRTRYLASKWFVTSLLAVLSVVVGLAGAGYYTTMLGYGAVSWASILGAALLYGLYCVFIVGVTLLTSALFAHQLAAGGLALLVSIGLTLAGYLLPEAQTCLPIFVGGAAKGYLQGVVVEGTLTAVFATAVWTLLVLGAARWALERKAL